MSDFDDDSDYYLASDSSEDEDLDELQGIIPRIKNENYLEVTIPGYDEESFFMHFRMRREHAIRLAENYEDSHFYTNKSGMYGKLSPLSQVLIFLWYVGHATASFRDVSDRFDISVSSLHRIINRLSIHISNLSSQIITWPDNEEKIAIEQHFRQKGFPDVIGAIDGTHIKIDKPENDAESYINRKGYYSIQMQVVSDHQRKIRDVFIGFPGSVHDARVFRNSPLCANLEELCGRYILLGDSAYPLKKNLLVPFKDRGQLTQRQVNFNLQLSKNRYVIEHLFGILKQKFRQLYHIKLRNIELIVHFIRAACVLHNICIADEFVLEHEAQDLLPPQHNIGEENEDDDNEADVDARRLRDHYVNILRMVRNN